MSSNMIDGTFEIFSPHVTIYVCHCLLVLYPEQLYIMVLNLSLNMWTHKQLFTDIYMCRWASFRGWTEQWMSQA
jgi:hypothetical protein